MHRETSAILKRDIEPHLLFEAVVKDLSDSGMTVDSVEHGEGFSFVLLQKGDIRAALSGGATGPLSCVSAVLVGDDRKEVATISSKLAKVAD